MLSHRAKQYPPAEAATPAPERIAAKIGINVGAGLAACIGSIVAAVATAGAATELAIELCGKGVEMLLDAAKDGADLAGIPMCPQ